MAAGKPIVATNVGGVPEVVAEGKNAILVDPDSPDALAEGILRLLKKPLLANRYGKYSRKRAGEFSWGEITQKYIHYYSRLIDS